MKPRPLFALLALSTLVIAQSASADYAMLTNQAKAPLRDGELALPADYAAWPVFLRDIQRPELKQIRDIYINPQGLKSSRPFAYGTRMVMEIHSVKVDAEGKPLLDAAGRMQRQGLARVFVMGKEVGWGQEVAPELRTGEWLYGAFDAKGVGQGGDAKACRGCHVPLKDTDFVARVPEFEASRGR